MHLGTVNALNGSTALGISPEGREWRWHWSRGAYSCADRNWMILLQHANVHVRLLVNYRMDLWNSTSVLLAIKTGGAQAVLQIKFENSKAEQ